MLLSVVYFVKLIHCREVIENFAERCTLLGNYFVILKQGGCTLKIKITRD